MPRFVILFSALALIAAAVLSMTPAPVPVSAQPIATTRALLGQNEDDALSPTPSDVDEDDDGEAGEEPAESDESSTDRPDGLPVGVVVAEVTGHVDGDKFTINQQNDDGDDREVLLLGLDAPELDEGNFGECYAQEAADALEDLLPEGTTVFLEADQDDTDNRDRLLRYVWFDDDGEASHANEVLLREGNGSFQNRADNNRRNDELTAAEEEAREDDAGLWGECGENHVEITPTPVPPTEPPTIDEAIAEYPPLADVRELAIRPGDLFGERVAFSGTVLSIRVAPPGQQFGLGDADERGYSVQMQVNVVAPDGSVETVFVGYNGDTAGIFEGSFVSVFGTVVDTQSFENAIGGGVTQPLVDAALVVLG